MLASQRARKTTSTPPSAVQGSRPLTPFVSFLDGAGELVNALVAKLSGDLRLNTGVTHIERTADGYVILARQVRVLDSKRAGQTLAVKLEGIDDMDAARLLNGAEVQVDRSELPAAGPKEHYLHDLMGLDAVNREGVPLGKVADILEMPAHPLLVLRDGKVERLVPLVPARLVAVDLGAGRVTVDWHPDD